MDLNTDTKIEDTEKSVQTNQKPLENVPDHAADEVAQAFIRAKCARFNQWCKDVGILIPKIDYPEFFEGGLVGGKVNAPIEHREAFLFVPYKVVISLDKCLKDPSLFYFYDDNKQIFTKKHRDWEQLILTTFLMHQKQLGDKSYWAPYIELMPDVTFFCDLDKKDIMATMDPYIVADSIEYREELEDEWVELLEILEKYPDLFNAETRQRKNFMSIYAQVCSRCFGWGMPYTSMIPMADNLNHSDVNVVLELIHKSIHLKPDEENTYFYKAKYMNSYAQVYSAEEIKQNPVIMGRFCKENFEENTKLSEPVEFKKHAESKFVWQIPFLCDNFDEDNDTDKESSEEEEYYEEDAGVMSKMVDLLKNLMTKKTSQKALAEIKKGGGLRFFVKQEKLFIANEKDEAKKLAKENGEQTRKSPILENEYHEIQEYQLNRNEYIDPKLAKKPFKPKKNGEEESSSSDESDEGFDWYKSELHDDEMYIVFCNLQRRTLVPGEQAYYCYGNRSNKFLLMHYGFCFLGNRYDSFAIKMRMDIDLKDPFVPFMVDFRGEHFTQEVRLKNEQLNDLLLSYFRSVLKASFFTKQKTEKDIKRILLTLPVNLYFERYCIQFYEQILDFLQANLEKHISLEKDLEQLRSGQDISWGLQMSLVYRIGKKQIIRNQLHLIKFVKRVLAGAEAAILNSDDAYRQLILEETEFEKEQMRIASEIADSEKRVKQEKVLTEAYWYRRLINHNYFRAVYNMIKQGDYI